MNFIDRGRLRVIRKAQLRETLRGQVSQKLRENLLISGTAVGDNSALITRAELHVRAQRGGDEHAGNLRTIE